MAMPKPSALERSSPHSRPRPGFLSRLTTACLRPVRKWHDRHLQRIDLRSLDEHLLSDIGLSPEDVRRECTKPFWR
jgi:uncharacterized protein YjiS (DUF1127 family)